MYVGQNVTTSHTLWLMGWVTVIDSWVPLYYNVFISAHDGHSQSLRCLSPENQQGVGMHLTITLLDVFP